MLTCREFIEFLMEYLDRALPDQRLTEFERHLGLCTSCQAYLQNYQATVRLGKAAFADADALDPEGAGLDGAVPEDVPEDLVKAILAARAARS